MRTTLTVDDDVAAKLKRLAKDRSFKETVNEALRAGLHALESADNQQDHYRTEAVVGRPRLKNLDNIAEVLSESEREDWR
jgi:Arc/MetJ family transcription regulator